jgi:hypothetical protein
MDNRSKICPVCGTELEPAGQNASTRKCKDGQTHVCSMDDEIYENFLVKEALVGADRNDDSS